MLRYVYQRKLFNPYTIQPTTEHVQAKLYQIRFQNRNEQNILLIHKKFGVICQGSVVADTETNSRILLIQNDTCYIMRFNLYVKSKESVRNTVSSRTRSNLISTECNAKTETNRETCYFVRSFLLSTKKV